MHELSTLEQIAALVPPATVDLLRARQAAKDPSIQGLFDQASMEAWDLECLTDALREGLSRYWGEPCDSEIPQYLAQEFMARDKTKTLVVSSETGLAVAEVDPDSFYQPDPVAREGTDTLVLPLPRLKPEVEAAIIQVHHTRALEGQLVQRMREKQRSSALQVQEGDLRFRILTRSGRKSLAEQLRQELPELLRDSRGSMGCLLGRCRINEPVPREHSLVLDARLHARAALLVADPLAHNFRHDVFRTVREQIRAAWTRSLSRTIAGLAHRNDALAVTVISPLPTGLLIVDPNVGVMSSRLVDTLAIPDALAVVLDGTVHLTVDEDRYVLDSYEQHAKWCLQAEVDLTLHLDPSSLHPLIFTDVQESGISVEVL